MHVWVMLQQLDARPVVSVERNELTSSNFHVTDNFRAGLEEGLVQELAYQLFLSTCGYDCSPDNLQSIRRHLQVLTALRSTRLLDCCLGTPCAGGIWAAGVREIHIADQHGCASCVHTPAAIAISRAFLLG